MKKISVILTTYNSELYIKKVLDSIFKQEGVNHKFTLQVIVVDDCSTDSTCNIVNKENAELYSTNANTGGPNSGRNIGLSKVKGDYIIIADHDDIWFSDRINKMLSVIDISPIITSGYILNDISKKDKIERYNTSNSNSHYILYDKNITFKDKLIKSNKGQITYLGSIMFSASFKNILFEQEIGMIDFDWVLRLFHNNTSVELCCPLYIRKVRKNNLSLDEDYRIKDYNFSLRFIDNYTECYPDEVLLSKKKINGTLARYYYLIGNMYLARKYFLKSTIEIKTILYVITTFVGSKLVRKYFNIFG